MLDEAGRVLVEVVQRRWARSVHDVHVRTGDLPEPLPLVVAWTLALAVAPPVPETRRPRWTAHGACVVWPSRCAFIRLARGRVAPRR